MKLLWTYKTGDAIKSSPQKNNPTDQTNEVRRSSRIRREPERFTFNAQHGYKTVKAHLKKVYRDVARSHGQTYDMRYILALLIDPDFGIHTFEVLAFYVNGFPFSTEEMDMQFFSYLFFARRAG